MTKAEKKELRSDLFRHLDGIVTAPTAFALYKKGVLKYLLEQKQTTVKAIAEQFKANEGYLNVALRILASQAWLKHEILEKDQIKISLTENSETAFELVPLYEDVVELLQLSGKYHKRKFQIEPFLKLEKIFRSFSNNYGIEFSNNEATKTIQQQVLKHIEGIIVGPTAVALGMNGMFHKYFMEASFQPEEFHSDGDSFARLLDMFVFLNWFEKKNGNYRFTQKGLFYAKRASAYGVTVSYIPTFRKVSELIFGDTTTFWNLPEGSAEIHVDR
ncbi:MAG: class I SAM-dependent methyltransferase, partial [Saprospiraceae bacterium]